MKKYNYELHKYENYEVPKNWFCKSFCDNLDELVNCAKCGKELKCGDAYTSKIIQNDFGFGYMICEKCANKEWLVLKK